MKISLLGPDISHMFFADDLLLFAEATETQATTISNCLSLFCTLYGQKVNLNKSSVYFSQGVEEERKECTSSLLGTISTSLKKYLGVPSFTGRVHSGLFQQMVDRVGERLEGWKTKLLTLAGRGVLAQSALTTISLYMMQSTLLPVSICNLKDKRVRNFIWGSSTEKRRIHLAN